MTRKTCKKLIALLATTGCLLGSVAFGVACDGETPSAPTGEVITLVDFNDETLEVGYGDTYNLQLMATDEDGAYQVVKGKVTTKSGKAIEVMNGKFVVLEKEGYIVTYSFTSGGKTVTRKVTLNVVAKNEPIITIDGEASALICGQTYSVPTASAYDYYDGALLAETALYKKGDQADTKLTYDTENNAYDTLEVGEYYVLYTATNSNGVKAEKKLPFYVRKPAEQGEWDSFDDVGCTYTTETYNGVRKLSYLESYEGREGVLCVGLNGSVSQWTTFWSIAPKSSAMSSYEDYSYIALSIYVDGDLNDLQNIRLMKDCRLYDLKAGEWITYYFDAKAWLTESRWNVAIGENATADGKKELQGQGSVFGNVDIYFDSIYFVNEVPDLACTFEETAEGVKPAFTGAEIPDGYKVSYNGRQVAVKDGLFQANYVGEYVITPAYHDKDKATFKTFTYQSTGEHSIKLNAYDSKVAASATTFTEPELVDVVDGTGEAVEGYTVTKKITYKDALGAEKAVLTITPANKGWYTYVFTATKEGAKKLEASVTVTVGDFLSGELLNVNDANAAKRFSSMFTNGEFESFTVTAENVETEGLPADMVGNTYVKHAYDTQHQYTANNNYMNILPYHTRQEIEACTENVITFSFYLKATAAEGKTPPTVTLKFLGETKEVEPNSWAEFRFSYSTLLSYYHVLGAHTTWADYAIHVSTQIRDFSEFVFYFDSMVMVEETDVPYAVRVTQANTGLIYNKDIKNDFVEAGAEEITDFTGGYAGSAVKMYIDTNPNYAFKNLYKPSKLNALKKEYNTVTMWIAVDGITKEDGKAYFMGSGGKSFIGRATGKNTAFTMADNGKWVRYSISLTDYIALLAETNYEYCPLANIWKETALVEQGELAYLYVGNIEFTYVKPDVLVVSSTNYANIYNNDIPSYFVEAGAEEIKDFTGGYTGNATKMYVANNGGYRFKNPFTAEELTSLSAKYSKVSLWLACGSMPEGSSASSYSTSYFLTKAGGASFKPETNGQWKQYSITMEDYIALVAETNYEYCPLMKIDQVSAYQIGQFYIGDITLEA